jgi:glucosamine-6-phosphate deaminase
MFGKAKVLLYEDADELVADAAEELFGMLIKKPKAVLALPTGATYEPFYAYVAANYERRRASFREATAFNIDEYVGIPADDPQSYSGYMRRNLYSKIDMQKSNAFLPDGNAKDLGAEAAAYEKRIEGRGGIDLEYLGIGVNGHIGFNEPGTPFGSRTRAVELTESTKDANSKYFKGGRTPSKALTLGIGTMMEARKVILIATGESKQEIIGKMLLYGKTENIPASALADHENATIMIDSRAAPSDI